MKSIATQNRLVVYDDLAALKFASFGVMAGLVLFGAIEIFWSESRFERALHLPLWMSFWLTAMISRVFDAKRIEIDTQRGVILSERYSSFGTKVSEVPLSTLIAVTAPARTGVLLSEIGLLVEDDSIEVWEAGFWRGDRALENRRTLARSIADFAGVPLQSHAGEIGEGDEPA